MKTFRRILFGLVGYVLSKMALLAIFSFAHYKAGMSFSYHELFMAMVAGESVIDANSPMFSIWCSYFHGVLNFIVDSVFAGYVFAYMLNRTPNIMLPQKLVIRHRTSENVNGLLSLGVLVGNKSRYALHSVKCIVSCSYVKRENPLYMNVEFQLEQEIQQLHNYFRFSFDIDKFPRKFLSDFVFQKNRAICVENDSITITITGNANNLGNTFLVSKKYTLNDIIYDEHIPDLSRTIKNPFTGKPLYKLIKWHNFNKYVTNKDKTKQSEKEIIRLLL